MQAKKQKNLENRNPSKRRIFKMKETLAYIFLVTEHSVESTRLIFYIQNENYKTNDIILKLHRLRTTTYENALQ